MMWNVTHSEERLTLWKNLRNALKELPLVEQLGVISKFFSQIPTGARTIDYYNPINWPSPWEIFYHGEFCRSSISLAIFHTFAMLNGKEKNIELWVVKDNSGDYLLPIIDNQFILNYEAGKISKHSDVCDYFIVMQKFSIDQIKTIT